MKSRVLLAVLSLVVLCGCAIGPASILAGRSAYREVINQTEDEQLLNLIVRDRYGASYGVLAVATVTASLRARVDTAAQWGISRSMEEDYAGNLVPLQAGVAIEENPTISYVPIGGEMFVQRLLNPLSIEEILLMGRFLPEQRNEYLRVLVKSINGIRNPLIGGSDQDAKRFERVTELWWLLVRSGSLHMVRNAGGDYFLSLHVRDGKLAPEALELLDLSGIRTRPADGKLLVPIRVAAQGWEDDAFNLENCSVIEVLRAAGACIDIPAPHLSAGILEPIAARADSFLRIRSARMRPPGAGTVAIQYRGWWYYVDDADPASKRSFLFLRTLVGLRLYERSKGIDAPVLTIPVR